MKILLYFYGLLFQNLYINGIQSPKIRDRYALHIIIIIQRKMKNDSQLTVPLLKKQQEKLRDLPLEKTNSNLSLKSNKSAKQPATNFANQILIGVNKNNEPATIYFPAYLTVKVNSIQSISIGESVAKMNLTLIYSIYFGQKLSDDFINRVCLQLQIHNSRDEPVNLKKNKEERAQQQQEDNQDDQQESSQQQQANIYQKNFDRAHGIKLFIINKTFQVSLTPYASFTPFQVHDLNIYFELRKLNIDFKTQTDNLRKLEVKFNFMSTNTNTYEGIQKVLDCMKMNSFGYYNLLDTFLAFQCTMKRPNKQLPELFNDFPWSSGLGTIKQEKKDQKKKPKQSGKKSSDLSCLLVQKSYKLAPQIEEGRKKVGKIIKDCGATYFQYAKYHIPIYKKPMVSFATIFIPLWVLSFINLSLFFCQNDYAQRLTAIATLTLAFIPTVQMIRNQIPQTPRVTFAEMAIYAQIFATFLFLMQSYTKRLNEDYEFCPYLNIFFIVSLAITLFIIFAPIATYVIYHSYLLKHSLQSKSLRQKMKIQKEFKKQEWSSNMQADKFFKTKKKLLKTSFENGKLIKQLLQWTKLTPEQQKQRDNVDQNNKQNSKQIKSSIKLKYSEDLSKAINGMDDAHKFKSDFFELVGEEETDKFIYQMDIIKKWQDIHFKIQKMQSQKKQQMQKH